MHTKQTMKDGLGAAVDEIIMVISTVERPWGDHGIWGSCVPSRLPSLAPICDMCISPKAGPSTVSIKALVSVAPPP